MVKNRRIAAKVEKHWNNEEISLENSMDETEEETLDKGMCVIDNTMNPKVNGGRLDYRKKPKQSKKWKKHQSHRLRTYNRSQLQQNFVLNNNNKYETLLTAETRMTKKHFGTKENMWRDITNDYRPFNSIRLPVQTS